MQGRQIHRAAPLVRPQTGSRCSWPAGGVAPQVSQAPPGAAGRRHQFAGPGPGERAGDVEASTWVAAAVAPHRLTADRARPDAVPLSGRWIGGSSHADSLAAHA